MALKDTLAKLRQQSEQADQWEGDKPKLIEAWRQDVVKLFEEIRGYLYEYQVDNSMSFTNGEINISEETLGQYRISTMLISTSSAVIVVDPIARAVFGATGRVDMYRKGRVGEADRIMLLRMQMSQIDQSSQWVIARPPETGTPRTTQLGSYNGPWGASRFAVLTKETLEISIEFLLSNR